MSRGPVSTPVERAAGYDVAALRAAEFPWTTDRIYLNNASTGPIPERTRRALDEFNRLRTRPFELPDTRLFAIFAESRRLAAQLVNASIEEVSLAINTSWGLNLAAGALPLAEGDVVVVSDREFPANVYPWMRLKERGVRLELAPTTAEGWPDEEYLLERVGDPRVKALAVSLTQFSNGYTVDLARLSAATRAHGVFLVVDAIQGVGQIPVDVRATPVDVLACGAQKWLLSPWGSGFTYVRRELIPQLAPAMVSWMAFEGTDDFSRLVQYADTLRADARRFDFITLPYQDFAGMNASLGLLLELGVDAIRDHLRGLAAPLLEWAARRHVRVASPTDAHASAITCLVPPNAAAVHARLLEAGVVTSLREGGIRVSPHAYNTLEEMERVVGVLDQAV